MKKTLFVSAFLTTGLLTTLIFATPVFAGTFNPNNVLADSDLRDGDAMSATRLQSFLTEKGSYLAQYSITDPFGKTKTAAQVIYDAGKYYNVSQRVLLATIQKEQSLITDASPTARALDWATGFGVCDSCSKDDPAIKQFKGFYNQINWTAKQFARYYDEPGRFRHQVGETYNIDGTLVTPANLATAGQYNYTPHTHGVELFHTIMQRYFAKDYLNGTLLRSTEDGAYYVIQGGKKSEIVSDVALRLNFDAGLAIDATPNSLGAYEDAPPIIVPNGTVVRAPWGTVYMVLSGKRRGFTNREVLRVSGVNPEEILNLSNEEISQIPEGSPITSLADIPTDRLLQSRTSGGIIYIDETGVAHPIYDRVIYDTRFRARKPVAVSQEEIDAYDQGAPLTIPDGYLVTSKETRGAVYVISDGKKYRFPNAQSFTDLGYKFNKISFVTQRVLDLHEDGGVIEVEVE